MSEQILDRQPIQRVGAFEKRIHEVDFTRGLCMFLVFFDHFMWNLSHYFPIWNSNSPHFFFQNVGDFALWYWNSPLRLVVQFIVLALFMFLSGISTAFSKNNWQRTGYMIMLWIVLFVGGNIVNASYGSGAIINWNVIANVAFCCLFYCLIQDKSWKSVLAVALICTLAFLYVVPILFYFAGNGATYVPPLWADYSRIDPAFYNPAWKLPDGSWPPHLGDMAVNGKIYFNADYMPFFPFSIAFFGGALFSKFFYKERKSLFKTRHEFERPICYIGRHSLVFYLGHQIVFLGLFSFIGLVSGLGL